MEPYLMLFLRAKILEEKSFRDTTIPEMRKDNTKKKAISPMSSESILSQSSAGGEYPSSVLNA